MLNNVFTKCLNRKKLRRVVLYGYHTQNLTCSDEENVVSKNRIQLNRDIRVPTKPYINWFIMVHNFANSINLIALYHLSQTEFNIH